MLEWIASSCALILAVLLLRRLLRGRIGPVLQYALWLLVLARLLLPVSFGEPRAGRGREGGVAGSDLCKPNRAQPGPL